MENSHQKGQKEQIIINKTI